MNPGLASVLGHKACVGDVRVGPGTWRGFCRAAAAALAPTAAKTDRTATGVVGRGLGVGESSSFRGDPTAAARVMEASFLTAAAADRQAMGGPLS